MKDILVSRDHIHDFVLGLLSFCTCQSSDILRSTVFQKMDAFMSFGVNMGSAYSVGFIIYY
jgi:hypothetical protein